ncbi:hypothetical protein N9K75_02110 [bacterium]|nr:hypothetical protein [bacterium]
MTKKDAIDKIARYVNNKIQFRDNWTLAVNQAEDIMEIVEGLGMLPPRLSFMKQKEMDLIKHDIYLDVHVWEDQ